MSNELTNKVAGSGQASHEVPTAPGKVVFMTDGGHAGTSIWLHPEESGPLSGQWLFASHDQDTVRSEPRAILVLDQDLEEMGDSPYGCDSEGGLALIGVSLDDDLSWLTSGSEVLWDSSQEEEES